MEDTVVLLTGGEFFGAGSLSILSSSEVFPSNGCSLPSLPQPRRGHVLFATADQNPKIVTCGGSDQNDIFLASCPVFDPETQRWDADTMSPLFLPRVRSAAVTMESIGVYLIGGGGTYLIGGVWVNNENIIDFFAQDHQQWMPLAVPVNMNSPCAVPITKVSFLAIHDASILEYQVDKTDPTSLNGWQEASKWPRLQTRRTSWPGCSKIDEKVVIAGGQVWYGTYGISLRSTEVLDLSTRKLEYAGDLSAPRYGFHIVTINEDGVNRVLALAGSDGSLSSPHLDSVEEFDPESLTWKPAPMSIVRRRSFFAAVVLPQKLIRPI